MAIIKLNSQNLTISFPDPRRFQALRARQGLS